jgi:cell division septum initiation protein DivIVA
MLKTNRIMVSAKEEALELLDFVEKELQQLLKSKKDFDEYLNSLESKTETCNIKEIKSHINKIETFKDEITSYNIKINIKENQKRYLLNELESLKKNTFSK